MRISIFLFLALLSSSGAASANNAEEVSAATMQCATIEAVFATNPLTCEGTPRRTLKIPCQSGPGSPCISDHDHFPGISVKDIYCTEQGFHETVYRGSEACDASEGEEKKAVYPKDTCTEGMKFVSCTADACNGGEFTEGEEFVLLPEDLLTELVAMW